MLDWIDIEELYWSELSSNINAIDLLKNKINWIALSHNQNAIDLLKENQDKIDWYLISSNLSILEDEPMPTI